MDSICESHHRQAEVLCQRSSFTYDLDWRPLQFFDPRLCQANKPSVCVLAGSNDPSESHGRFIRKGCVECGSPTKVAASFGRRLVNSHPRPGKSATFAQNDDATLPGDIALHKIL